MSSGHRGHEWAWVPTEAGEAGSGREKGRLAEGKGLAPTREKWARETGAWLLGALTRHGSSCGQQEVGALGKLGRKTWQ